MAGFSDLRPVGVQQPAGLGGVGGAGGLPSQQLGGLESCRVWLGEDYDSAMEVLSL